MTLRPDIQPRHHVALILDQSGSMRSCREATIEGFNGFLQSVRAGAMLDGVETRITLTTFNHAVWVRQRAAQLHLVHPLTSADYIPAGRTAMLDAVGTTLTCLRHAVRSCDTCLVCIVSDGEENASQIYTHTDIAASIKRRTATERWTFTYMGANQDLSQVASHLGIPVESTTAFGPTGTATIAAWSVHTGAYNRYRRRCDPQSAMETGFYHLRDLTRDNDPR